jgi:hypothetical protein
MFKHLCMMAVFGLSIGTAHADSGNSATFSGSVSARVVRALVLNHQNGATLRFGKFAASGAGTVVINSAGNGTATGAVTFVPGSVTSTDRFRVVGDPVRQFSITTGSGNVTSGPNSMPFTTTPVVATSTLPGSGIRFFDVAGTLTVPSFRPSGTYTGSYAVTVAYN